MSRSSMFNSPLMVGFDGLEQLLDRMSKTQNDGYPPYNIEQLDEMNFRISLAVAGFSEADLDVSVEDHQLVIRGRQDDDDGRVFLHRGIAARHFQRSFVLADGLQVKTADLNNGLLHIDLERIPPEVQAQKIKISTDTAKGTG